MSKKVEAAITGAQAVQNFMSMFGAEITGPDDSLLKQAADLASLRAAEARKEELAALLQTAANKHSQILTDLRAFRVAAAVYEQHLKDLATSVGEKMQKVAAGELQISDAEEKINQCRQHYVFSHESILRHLTEVGKHKV